MALLNKTTLIPTLAIFLLSLSLNVSSALAIPPGNPFNSLSEEDKGRIVKILQDISKKKDQPTRETFREFWIIWEKQGRWPEADIQDLRDYLVGPSLIYMT